MIHAMCLGPHIEAGSASHISHMLGQIASSFDGTVHHGGVIPHNYVAVILSVNALDVFGLAGELEEFIDQSLGILVRHAVDVVDVGCAVKEFAAGVDVVGHQLVLGEGVVAGVDVGIVLWGSHLAVVPHGVVADKVLDLGLRLLGEVLVGVACIKKLQKVNK
jgi:hypothetical protein